MGRLVAGNLVVGYFPFSEPQVDPLTGEQVRFKKRPCIVLAGWLSGASSEVLVCMATTQKARDPYCMDFGDDHLEWGQLGKSALVRPTYLFVGNENYFDCIGHLKPDSFESIRSKVREVLSQKV